MPDNELTATIDAIVHAIVHRRHLSFVYKGHWRRVMPMIFGRSEDGTWRLRALELGGPSSVDSAGKLRPKIFNLAGISEAKVHDSTFKVPRQFEPEDPLITQPEVRLEFDPPSGDNSRNAAETLEY